MIADCAEPGVFFYSNPNEEAEKGKVHFAGNVSVELYFDLTALICQEILAKTLIREMSDKELIEAAEKTGTFEFWNNARDDIYNDLL